MKKIVALFLAVTLSFSLAACGEKTVSAEKPESVEVEATLEPVVEATPEPTPEPVVEAKETVNVEQIISVLDVGFKDRYDYYSIDGNENLITVNIAYNGLTAAIVTAINEGDENSWEQIKDSMLSLYSSSVQLMKTSDPNTPPLMLCLLNDTELANCLLIIFEDAVHYDAFAQN